VLIPIVAGPYTVADTPLKVSGGATKSSLRPSFGSRKAVALISQFPLTKHSPVIDDTQVNSPDP
jgi:hypothetical protein